MTCLVPSLKGIGIDTLLPSCDPQLKDLLCSMLRVDSAKRIKPLDILIHPFLDDLRDEQVFYSIMK
jgi:serine/threonine protein kinase